MTFCVEGSQNWWVREFPGRDRVFSLSTEGVHLILIDYEWSHAVNARHSG
jgi:hypothetical protein